MKIKPIHAIAILVLAVAAFIAFRTISDRRAEAERKIKAEQQIAEAANRVRAAEADAIDNYEKLEKSQASDREFNRFVYGTSQPPPEVVQRRIEQQLRETAERDR